MMASSAGKVVLRKLLEELKGSVAVYLTKEGNAEFRDSPYLRKNGAIICSKVYGSGDRNFLSVKVRYYQSDSQVPKHAFLAIPHRYIRFMESDAPLTLRK
jgi:hypothetical protein